MNLIKRFINRAIRYFPISLVATVATIGILLYQTDLNEVSEKMTLIKGFVVVVGIVVLTIYISIFLTPFIYVLEVAYTSLFEDYRVAKGRKRIIIIVSGILVFLRLLVQFMNSK